MAIKRQSLSPVDTAWLHMEDPTNLMMVTMVSLVEGSLNYDRMRRTLEERLLSLDRFRMRIDDSSVGVAHWEEDPNFDYDSHVHRIALPDPGDMAALETLLGDLSSTQLDFTKPVWHMHLVENVMGGSAIVFRFHHCLGDGTAMLGVMAQLLDTDQDAPIELPPTPEPAPKPQRSMWQSLFSPARSALVLSRKVAGTVIHESIDGLLHPSHLRRYTDAATAGAGVLARSLLSSPDPQTPFKGKLGVQKHVAWSPRVDLVDVKAIGRACDAKVNDVLIAAMTGALRHYLIERGVDVTDMEINAVIPVNLRPMERALELGNEFGLVFLSLPLGIPDPIIRLAAVKQRMDDIKNTPEAVIFFGLLGIFGTTPQQVEEQIVNIFGTKATSVLTNVPGPQQPLYIAGSRITDAMFWVPQSGRLGIGISIFSYDGHVALGVISDAGLVPDPRTITDRYAVEFAEMQAAVQRLEARKQREK